jgi:hypothetical protein
LTAGPQQRWWPKMLATAQAGMSDQQQITPIFSQLYPQDPESPHND